MNCNSMTMRTIMTLAALAGAAGMLAQQPVSEATALKNAYEAIKTNLTKAADRMPDDQYGFKASPDIRTFGALIAHIADVQGGQCAGASGGQRPASIGSKTAKADLVAGLKASFDLCDGVFSSLTDEDATKMVVGGRGGPRSKFALLWGLIVHSNEEYGYLSVYMRLKGIVPPSTQP